MRLGTRLAKVAKALRDRTPPGRFDLVELVPLGSERAEGRPLGLHRDGPEGSTAGVLVFDPREHEPVVPAGVLPPWGLVISCHLPDEEHLWVAPGSGEAPPGDVPGGCQIAAGF
jgi:hypothetical protein